MFILSLSSKRLKIREKRIELMIKSQILIGFIIAFTTVLILPILHVDSPNLVIKQKENIFEAILEIKTECN